MLESVGILVLEVDAIGVRNVSRLVKRGEQGVILAAVFDERNLTEVAYCGSVVYRNILVKVIVEQALSRT